MGGFSLTERCTTSASSPGTDGSISTALDPRPVTDRRSLAWGGVIGPVGFVTAWATAGAVTSGYSPIEDAVSRLAAIHAPTRWVMTAGFVCFGVAVPVYSLALREAIAGRAWLAAMVTGLATFGVAAVPLDVSKTTDLVHGGFASVGYASLALTPLLAAGPLAARGYRRKLLLHSRRHGLVRSDEFELRMSERC